MRTSAYASHKLSHRVMGALALSTAGVFVVGGLSACTPPHEKDAAQAPAEASVEGTSIKPVAEKIDGLAVPYSKITNGVTVTVHDLLKPGNEIMVSAQCDAGTHATLSSSVTTKKVDMTPAADMGELIGTFTAPAQIGAGPRKGYHTVTVTCDSGKTGTITLNSAGNGDNSHRK